MHPRRREASGGTDLPTPGSRASACGTPVCDARYNGPSTLCHSDTGKLSAVSLNSNLSSRPPLGHLPAPAARSPLRHSLETSPQSPAQSLALALPVANHCLGLGTKPTPGLTPVASIQTAHGQRHERHAACAWIPTLCVSLPSLQINPRST